MFSSNNINTKTNLLYIHFADFGSIVELAHSYALALLHEGRLRLRRITE